jgi:hypothetical protein
LYANIVVATSLFSFTNSHCFEIMKSS